MRASAGSCVSKDGMMRAMACFSMKAVLEFIDRQVVPSTSFGVFVLIEALFVYGLYKIFISM